MILYHGSNIEISQIDIDKGRKGKDFGKGFYLSEDIKQAEKMASLTTFRQGKGVPVVSKFMFDESILNGKSDIKIKQFGGYTIEWAEFILLNRNNNTNIQAHDYDIVIGPIADDTVGLQLRRFIQGYINISQLVNELSYIRPTIQYFFGTPAMNKEKQFLVESLGKELIEMLMSDYGWDLQKSMDVLYSSETFAKLEDERSGLYYQGAIYVYSFLKQEIEKGTID